YARTVTGCGMSAHWNSRIRRTWPGHQATYQPSPTVATTLAVLAVAVHVGRRRLLRAWHGEPPAVARTPVAFWTVAAAVTALYPVTWPLLHDRHAAHVQGVRLVWTVTLAL